MNPLHLLLAIPGLAVIASLALLLWCLFVALRDEDRERQADAEYCRWVQMASGETLVVGPDARPVLDEDTLRGVPL